MGYDCNKEQEEAIATALSELICEGDNASENAYAAIVRAIDSWLIYHATEKQKWQILREKITNPGEAGK